MTVKVALGVIQAPTAPVGGLAQAMTLPFGGLVSFPGSAAVPSGPSTAPFIQLPTISSGVTTLGGIRLIIHNFSVSTPVQPVLLNADNSVFNNSLSLAEPGGGQTSLGITNETAPLSLSPLKLAFVNLVVGEATGFTVETLAWVV